MQTNRPGPTRRVPPQYQLVDDVIEQKGGVCRFLKTSGVNVTTYYHLQSGRGNPTMRTINVILDYTGLTYEEAFRETPNVSLTNVMQGVQE